MISESRKNIFAFANQKGGVGKTTTAINLATALTAVDKRVLLVDFDPQGNASTGLGVAPKDRVHSTYDLLFEPARVQEFAMSTGVPGLFLLPASADLSAAEVELVNVTGRETRLKEALSHVQESFDYIFIDCPPSLGLLTLNALVCADKLLVPLQCEFFALEGLSQLLKTVTQVQKKLNPGLTLQGVVLTMYDRRSRLNQQVADDARGYLGDTVYATSVPRNVRMSEAPSHGKPALFYDFRCSGSQAYVRLAQEFIQREETCL